MIAQFGLPLFFHEPDPVLTVIPVEVVTISGLTTPPLPAAPEPKPEPKPAAAPPPRPPLRSPLGKRAFLGARGRRWSCREGCRRPGRGRRRSQGFLPEPLFFFKTFFEGNFFPQFFQPP